MVQGVVVTNFIAESNASKEAFKTATLLKTLNVNSLIIGDVGVGKKSLARHILPNAPILDASELNELVTALESSTQVIITNLQNSPNLTKTLDLIKMKNIKVVATTKYDMDSEAIDELFSIKFNLPRLKERPEDIEKLISIFSNEAASLFGAVHDFKLEDFIPDLQRNSHSLKRQVMINYLLQDIQDIELMEIIEQYLSNKLGSNSDYRDFLYLYEVPLIKSGLKKFKSQLKLSDKLGLNRNTLRKKIADNKKYL